MNENVFWLSADSKIESSRSLTGKDIAERANCFLPKRVNFYLDKGASVIDLAAIATALDKEFGGVPTRNGGYRLATPNEVVELGGSDNVSNLALIVDRNIIGKTIELRDLTLRIDLPNPNYRDSHLFIPTYMLRIVNDPASPGEIVLSVDEQNLSQIATGTYKPRSTPGLTWTTFRHLAAQNFEFNGSKVINYKGNTLYEGLGTFSVVGSRTMGIDGGIGDRNAIYGVPLRYIPPRT